MLPHASSAKRRFNENICCSWPWRFCLAETLAKPIASRQRPIPVLLSAGRESATRCPSKILSLFYIVVWDGMFLSSLVLVHHESLLDTTVFVCLGHPSMSRRNSVSGSTWSGIDLLPVTVANIEHLENPLVLPQDGHDLPIDPRQPPYAYDDQQHYHGDLLRERACYFSLQPSLCVHLVSHPSHSKGS